VTKAMGERRKVDGSTYIVRGLVKRGREVENIT